jgi:6-phosphofructokinase
MIETERLLVSEFGTKTHLALMIPGYMSTAHSTTETDICNDRVFGNVAVSVVIEQLADQLAEFQRSTAEAIETERLHVCEF